MTDPSRILLYLHIFSLWTGPVEGDVLASLAPPVHLSGERVGWTLLVCVVADLRRGHLEVTWRSSSSSQGHLAPISAPYSMARDELAGGRRAVAVVTVATHEWPSYSCSVSHRRHANAIRRHHLTYTDEDDGSSCHEHQNTVRGAIGRWTDHVTLLALRLLLLKTSIFNTLITTSAVIK